MDAEAKPGPKYSLPRFPDRDDEPAIAGAAHADQAAALRWVANGFDPDGRAAWALAPRSPDHERYLRQLGLSTEDHQASSPLVT
jgi:hypothetical protein